MRDSRIVDCMTSMTCPKRVLLSFSLVMLAACGDSGDAATGAGGSGASGTGGGTPCGAEVCSATEYCGFAPGACAGEQTCHPLPTTCQDLACGCDGENYATDCQALAASGGTTSVQEACAPPTGQFTCFYEYQVPIYCDLATEFCQVVPTGNVYALSCEPKPAGCTPAPQDCTCLMSACSDNYCGVDPETNAATVLCPLNG
jgi:hypothetical protein